ncbi:MAG TPA: EamA family transporter, partial [Chitinophagaceae bacterium]
IGFIGVTVLVGFDKSPHAFPVNSSMKTYGTVALIAGGISWTVGSLYSKYKPAKNSVLMNAAIQLLAAGLFTFLISFLSGELNAFSFSHARKEAWSALLYLIVMGSVIAYLSYLWLLKVRPTAQVSTYVYVNPVVAVLLGAIIVHEQITWPQITGLIIILCGVLMVNIARYKGAAQKV